LNLQKAFENPQDRLLPAFKSASWLWPAFKTGEIALAGIQKLSAQLREICYQIGAKDLNLLVFKSFSQIQKVFVLNVKEFINSM
jgi:hypothetical protein